MNFNARIAEVMAPLEDAAFSSPAPSTPSAEPRNARFVIAWNFDGTKTATVIVNRRAGTMEIRPYRRRRSYTYPLADVAQIVAERVVKAEARAKRLARKAVRR